MTYKAQLDIVKAMTGESNEGTINAFLEMAGDAIHNYVGGDKDAVLAQYGGVKARLAAYWLNKRGADGQTSHSENGISRGYEAGDIPPSLLRELVSKVVLV